MQFEDDEKDRAVNVEETEEEDVCAVVMDEDLTRYEEEEDDGPACACLFAAHAKAFLPALDRPLPAMVVATISMNEPSPKRLKGFE